MPKRRKWAVCFVDQRPFGCELSVKRAGVRHGRTQWGVSCANKLVISYTDNCNHIPEWLLAKLKLLAKEYAQKLNEQETFSTEIYNKLPVYSERA